MSKWNCVWCNSTVQNPKHTNLCNKCLKVLYTSNKRGNGQKKTSK